MIQSPAVAASQADFRIWSWLTLKYTTIFTTTTSKFGHTINTNYFQNASDESSTDRTQNRC